MSSGIPEEFAKKHTSRVTCPNCQHEFNFIHSKYGSITAVRASSVWIFRCPRCNQKESFDLTDHEYDSSIPTYVDPGFGKLFAFVIPLSIGLAISVTVLSIFLPSAYKALSLIPLIPYIIAMVWLTLLMMKASKIKLWKPA